jgi:hypothetical protein
LKFIGPLFVSLEFGLFHGGIRIHGECPVFPHYRNHEQKAYIRFDQYTGYTLKAGLRNAAYVEPSLDAFTLDSQNFVNN